MVLEQIMTSWQLERHLLRTTLQSWPHMSSLQTRSCKWYFNLNSHKSMPLEIQMATLKFSCIALGNSQSLKQSLKSGNFTREKNTIGMRKSPILCALFNYETGITRIYLENHDNARSVSRFGNDSPQWRAISAKLLAILQITQSGTLFVYQGEEIGMKNVPKTWDLSEYKDIASINFWKQWAFIGLVFLTSWLHTA